MGDLKFQVHTEVRWFMGSTSCQRSASDYRETQNTSSPVLSHVKPGLFTAGKNCMSYVVVGNLLGFVSLYSPKEGMVPDTLGFLFRQLVPFSKNVWHTLI